MERNNTINTAIGMGAGYGTYIAGKKLGAKALIKTLDATRINLTDDQITRMNKAVKEIINKEEFEAKGIKLIDGASDEYKKSSKEAFYKHLEELNNRINSTKNPLKKFTLILRKRRYQKAGLLFPEAVQEGKNACYKSKSKTIIVNMKNGVHTFFHEAGHALDFAKPIRAAIFSLGKTPFYIKYHPMITLGAALLTRPNKDKPTTPNEKVKSFIKKHCGIISTLGFIPMIASETSANINGQKLARKYADKIDMKTLTKSHLRSAAGYWALPLIIGLSVHMANKVGDKVIEKLNKN